MARLHHLLHHHPNHCSLFYRPSGIISVRGSDEVFFFFLERGQYLSSHQRETLPPKIRTKHPAGKFMISGRVRLSIAYFDNLMNCGILLVVFGPSAQW